MLKKWIFPHFSLQKYAKKVEITFSLTEKLEKYHHFTSFLSVFNLLVCQNQAMEAK